MTRPVQPVTAGTAQCMSCLDKGFTLNDGRPAACSCQAGQQWARRAYPGDGPWEGPNNLPPGGEVLLRQAAREAAGVPVAAVAGAPIRALLVDDATLQAALEHMAACASELPDDAPARRAASEFVASLPEHYRVTVPPFRKAAPKRKGAARGAMPLVPPPPQ